ncbi:MAG: hypothetical protein RQ864_02975 [Lutibacter sp.]|nr:hypothetical protein [Lutibacter sp.]MDT8416750.1 hypothetical protein [Lutibacter sp.]
MENIQSLADLEDAIKLLKFKKSEDEVLLKELFYMTYESVKPINMIKNLFKEPVGSQNIADNLLTTTVGFGAGYLSKLLFQKIVRIPFKNFIGSTLMMGVENLVAKNPGIISALSSLLLDAISGKSKKNADGETDDEQDNIHRKVKTEPIDFETIY